MVVTSSVGSFRQTSEAIQIQLALEGSKFGLIEVDGHDAFHKHLWFVHHEAPAMGLPGDDVAETVSFNLVEQFVESDREGCDDASSGDGCWDPRIDVIFGVIVVVVNDCVMGLVRCGFCCLALGCKERN